MCTVTFFRNGNKTIITSNRDESTSRPASEKPGTYNVNGKTLYYPRDPKAGGSWFAVDENASVAVLLNGAEIPHTIRGPFRKSRGLILLDILSAEKPLHAWNAINLNEVEPFTMVLYQDGTLTQLRWNYMEKSVRAYNTANNHIWSSVTLYSPEAIAQRKKWFREFQEEYPDADEHSILHFHSGYNVEDKFNGLLMNRENIVKTQSITQAVVLKHKVDLFYHDMTIKQEFSQSISTY